MMAFARKQRLEPKVFDVNTIFEPFVAMLRRTIPSNISVEFHLAPGDLLVNADAGLLENGLLNLCLNARDAMPSGGRLVIETSETLVSSAYVRYHVGATPGHYIVLAVSDNGTGMTKDVAAHVFEPFFTTKDVGKGNGLGLSMVYGFVKQSGGHATVYSEPGKGTTINIYLPRSEHMAANEIDELEVPTLQRKGKILCVEDDELVRDSVASQLVRLGHAVTQARTAAEAVEILESGAVFDLVFTDVMMPGAMTDINLAWQVHRR